MTFVLGMVCIDGVVLVADRQLTDDLDCPDYGPKLFGLPKSGLPKIPMICGFSGSESIFLDFRQQLEDKLVKEYNKTNVLKTDGVKKAIRDVRRDLTELYETGADAVPRENEAHKMEIAIAFRDKNGAHLFYSALGKFQPEPRYRILGGGDPYVSVLLKHAGKRGAGPLTMADGAMLGHFCVRYIVQFNLNTSIGLGDADPNRMPQILFLPTNRARDWEEPSDEWLDNLERWSEVKLDQSDRFLGDFFNGPDGWSRQRV